MLVEHLLTIWNMHRTVPEPMQASACKAADHAQIRWSSVDVALQGAAIM